MSTRKTNNSILVLATLGVYLGLVLIGATPQVLAQAAMTREFSVKDEIEVKDDLDTKPDSDKALDELAATIRDVYGAAAEISENHLNLVNEGRYSFSYYVSIRPNGAARYLEPGESKSDLVTNASRYFVPLRRLYEAFLNRSDNWHDRFLVQFEFGQNDVTFRATITAADPQSAAGSASSYEKALERKSSVEANLVKATILKSIEVTSKDDKIIVVTHLPRAGLDSLLASDAK